MGELPLRKLAVQNYLNFENTEVERYRSLLNILNGFEEYLLDTEGIVVSSNLEAVNVTGYEEWEIIGSHLSKFYTVEDQLTGVPQKDLERTSKKGSLVTTGLRIKKRNSSFWAKVKFRCLHEQGRLVGYKMTLQDATHRAVSSHRLRKLRDEYLSLFNNSSIGILKFSLQNHHILMMNEKAERILNRKHEDVRLSAFFEEREFHQFVTELERHRKVDDYEIPLSRDNRWVRMSFRYFSNGDFGEGIVVDITDFKNRELELIRVKHELDQFIYHASHELRGPLASLLGVVNLFEYDRDHESTSTYCAILRERIHGLDNLLKSIVAISLNNKNDMHYDAIDWQSVVPSVMRELGPNRVEISCTVQQTKPFTSDLNRIRIVLKNLFSNAIKYANPNVAKSTLQVSVDSNAHEAKITVKDNGIGIDPEYVPEIFKMFYKATPQPRGHGLGLYTVKVMMDKLNGKVLVESKLGEGTTFELVLPNEQVIKL